MIKLWVLILKKKNNKKIGTKISYLHWFITTIGLKRERERETESPLILTYTYHYYYYTYICSPITRPQIFKYRTDQLQDVKKMEKLTTTLMRHMVSRHGASHLAWRFCFFVPLFFSVAVFFSDYLFFPPFFFVFVLKSIFCIFFCIE